MLERLDLSAATLGVGSNDEDAESSVRGSDVGSP
jgi:hypothetical protein